MGTPDTSPHISRRLIAPNMTRQLLAVLALISLTLVVWAQSPPSIVGTWRLVTFETHNADGTVSYPFGKKPLGYFVYDSTGHLSVQIMRDPPMKDVPGLRQGKAEPDQYKEAFLAYAAYFGTYTVDSAKGTVTHHVEGANRPDYIGTDQPRPFRIEGDHLIIEITQGQTHLHRELVRVR
jgi:hypothetical protein